MAGILHTKGKCARDQGPNGSYVTATASIASILRACVMRSTLRRPMCVATIRYALSKTVHPIQEPPGSKSSLRKAQPRSCSNIAFAAELLERIEDSLTSLGTSAGIPPSSEILSLLGRSGCPTLVRVNQPSVAWYTDRTRPFVVVSHRYSVTVTASGSHFPCETRQVTYFILLGNPFLLHNPHVMNSVWRGMVESCDRSTPDSSDSIHR